MEGWFEQHPWLLVPLIIVVVEVWGAAKRLVRDYLGSRDNSSPS